MIKWQQADRERNLILQIIEKSITEITPYEKNPRENDEAVEYVANSIKEDDLGGGKSKSNGRSKRAEEKL